jgi:para-aminobenzoate synthetase/4-amino-4-deoxychorismate lyase
VFLNILFEFEKTPIVFNNPERIISCYHPQDIKEALILSEEMLAQGFYLAGFISYEAGYYFEEKTRVDKTYNFPLVYLGCYRQAEQGRSFFGSGLKKAKVSACRPDVSLDQYWADIAAIREHIRKGDVYQITYCWKMLFSFFGDPYSLYRSLLKKQPVPYPAYLETDNFKILSLSPEMFLKKKGDFISVKPMKGTAMRLKGIKDVIGGLKLKYDSKNRAENVMIADLLRNDLGRIAKKVRAPKLFEVARYKTLYQMTSTVNARIDKDIKIEQLFKSLFPSGSVTGAPKIRSMEIIGELEKTERKIYTGAIGYITPAKAMFFNIPIRTILLENSSGQMGVGGGIVWDSTAQGEWEEGMLKSQFLLEAQEG